MVTINVITNTDKCTISKSITMNVGDYTKIVRDTQDCSWGVSNNNNTVQYVDKGMENYECGIKALAKGTVQLYSVDTKTQVRENINITVI